MSSEPSSPESSAESEYSPPCGPRFSQLYLPRNAPVAESSRLRNRVAAIFEHDFHGYTDLAEAAIEKRIGHHFEYVGGANDIGNFLRNSTPPDFLDAITVIRQAMDASARYPSERMKADRWSRLCAQAFVEENVAYRIDTDGVVRPLVDEEYNRNLVSALAGLTDARLSAVRVEAERSFAALDARVPDTKGAVRAIFEAIEIYAKLISDAEIPRLTERAVNERLLPAILEGLGTDETAKRAARELAKALCDWIDSAHHYRHGQNVTEPAPPPFDLAVALVSNGAAFLRWVVGSTPHRLK